MMICNNLPSYYEDVNNGSEQVIKYLNNSLLKIRGTRTVIENYSFMLLFMGKNACLAYVKSGFRIHGIYLNNDRYNVKMNILMFTDLIEN